MRIIIFGGILFLACVGAVTFGWHQFNVDVAFRLGFREFKSNYWLERESYGCTEFKIFYESKYPYLCCYIGMKTPIDYARYRIWQRKARRSFKKRTAEKKLSIYRARAEIKRKEQNNIGGDKE